MRDKPIVPDGCLTEFQNLSKDPTRSPRKDRRRGRKRSGGKYIVSEAPKTTEIHKEAFHISMAAPTTATLETGVGGKVFMRGICGKTREECKTTAKDQGLDVKKAMNCAYEECPYEHETAAK